MVRRPRGWSRKSPIHSDTRFQNKTISLALSAARKGNLLVRGRDRSIPGLRTKVRLYPVEPEDLQKGIKGNEEGGRPLYIHFWGKRRRFQTVAERILSLRRWLHLKMAPLQKEGHVLETQLSQERRFKKRMRLNAVEDMEHVIPILWGYASIRVKLIQKRIEKLGLQLKFLSNYQDLTQDKFEQVDRIRERIHQMNHSLKRAEDRAQLLERSGSELSEYRRIRNQSAVFRKNFLTRQREMARYRDKSGIPENLTQKWASAGFNYYVCEVDRLTRELIILRLLGLHFQGRNKRSIRADMKKAHKGKRKFKRLMEEYED